MKRFAESAITLLLAGILLLGLTACADKQTKAPTNAPANPPAESATQETTVPKGTPVTLQAPVMETADWDTYTPAHYQKKEQLSVTLELPEGWTAEDTILYRSGAKCGELVGVIVPKEKQTAYDTLELNKDYNGVQYQEKGTDQLPNGVRYTFIMSDLPTETGNWYAYGYALPAGENYLLLTLYKTEKQAALSATDAALLQSAAVTGA